MFIAWLTMFYEVLKPHYKEVRLHPSRLIEAQSEPGCAPVFKCSFILTLGKIIIGGM